ncbi:MAG: hypothetical protein FRX49_08674 [Trebouxia sp. A1-2]|nr:MAG: hypothetical protein FRX49_08674 [Trebouxia sp. A1-2]
MAHVGGEDDHLNADVMLTAISTLLPQECWGESLAYYCVDESLETSDMRALMHKRQILPED